MKATNRISEKFTLRLILYSFIFLMTISTVSCQKESSNKFVNKGFLTVKDHKVYYEAIGTGVPILLIHGGYLNLEAWNEQVAFLNNNGFRTIVFDDLGHGNTINGKEQLYGYDIIDALRKKFEIKKLNIVGLSWGSMLALDFALNKPNNIDKLVLISPGRNGWNYFQDHKAEQNFEKRQKAKDLGDKKGFVEYFQKNWTDGPSQSPNRVPKIIRNTIENLLLNTVENHWNEDWSSLSKNTEWTSIKARTLMVTGGLDAIDIHEIAKLYNNEINNIKWIEIKNAAHTLNIEKPDEINRIILKFLSN